MTTRGTRPSAAVPTESQEMRMLARWLDLVGVLWAHPPNEGRRSPRLGARMKAEGMRKGLPDALIFTPPPGRPLAKGVALELKRVEGSKVSEDQRRWLIELGALGWVPIIAKGAREAVSALESLGYSLHNRSNSLPGSSRQAPAAKSRMGGRVAKGAGLPPRVLTAREVNAERTEAVRDFH